MEVLESKLIEEYKNMVVPMLSRNFPMLSKQEINRAVNWSINDHFRNSKASLYNNYKEKTLQSSLLEMVEYILSRKPIMTPSGCLFQKHADIENPFAMLIDTFIQNRVIHKKEMFKYPKGSILFEKYNLLQLLDKIDAKIRPLVSLNPFNCWKLLRAL